MSATSCCAPAVLLRDGSATTRPKAWQNSLEKSGKLSAGQSVFLSWLNLFRELSPQMLNPTDR